MSSNTCGKANISIWSVLKLVLMLPILLMTILGAYELYIGDAGRHGYLHCYIEKGHLLHVFHIWNGSTICITDAVLLLVYLCWRYTPTKGDVPKILRWSTVGILPAAPIIDFIVTVVTVFAILVPNYNAWVEDQSVCSAETYLTAWIASIVNLALPGLLGLAVLGVFLICSRPNQPIMGQSRSREVFV